MYRGSQNPSGKGIDPIVIVTAKHTCEAYFKSPLGSSSIEKHVAISALHVLVEHALTPLYQIKENQFTGVLRDFYTKKNQNYDYPINSLFRIFLAYKDYQALKISNNKPEKREETPQEKAAREQAYLKAQKEADLQLEANRKAHAIWNANKEREEAQIRKIEARRLAAEQAEAAQRAGEQEAARQRAAAWRAKREEEAREAAALKAEQQKMEQEQAAQDKAKNRQAYLDSRRAFKALDPKVIPYLCIPLPLLALSFFTYLIVGGPLGEMILLYSLVPCFLPFVAIGLYLLMSPEYKVMKRLELLDGALSDVEIIEEAKGRLQLKSGLILASMMIPFLTASIVCNIMLEGTLGTILFLSFLALSLLPIPIVLEMTKESKEYKDLESGKVAEGILNLKYSNDSSSKLAQTNNGFFGFCYPSNPNSQQDKQGNKSASLNSVPAASPQ